MFLFCCIKNGGPLWLSDRIKFFSLSLSLSQLFHLLQHRTLGMGMRCGLGLFGFFYSDGTHVEVIMVCYGMYDNYFV